MTVRSLIDGGSDIEDVDNEGKTALQIAIGIHNERLNLFFVID